MASDKQGFPDDRDRQLQRQAESTWQMADELVEWIGQFGPARRDGDHEINPNEEFQLLRLRRLSSNLCRSSEVPVASAVYGPSQVGKSLFVGRVLEPADNRDSPLGKCDQMEPDAYVRELSFNLDINPQSGSNEATALVTRFTTKDRFDKEALPEYPVKVRALTRAEWMRVLARGFRSECVEPASWKEGFGEGQIRALFEEVSQTHASEEVDREWRMDLIDVYAYMRGLDHRLYRVEESLFNSFLSQYPLNSSGYAEVAGHMFWDRENYPAISALFNNVQRFIHKVTEHGRDGMLVHWGAVRFLLDSQRSARQKSESSRWKPVVEWSDFTDTVRDGWCVLDYRPGAGPPSDDLATIQSAMLEMVVPVIPHRLNEDWRDVVQKMDVLDLPGMRSGKGDGGRGASSIETEEEKMNIVKRGKVFYLIDRYIEERQVQTLLLLIRGGTLEVRGLLKLYIDKWGAARYGEDVWPRKVADDIPALFIGMTGIDDEFENRELSEGLYDQRLTQIIHHTLHEVMTDFGGEGQPFTNTYPIRYPGTWDADEARRRSAPEKWDEAGRVFVQSSLVKTHVRKAKEKWEAAMRDNDGGLSLISKGFLQCTSALAKQDTLQEAIKKVHQDLRGLAESWYLNPDSNADRQKRLATAGKMLDWLDDEEKVYARVHALQNSLCFEDGDAMEVAEFSDIRALRARSRPESVEQRFPKHLRMFLDSWARELAPERWRRHVTETDRGAPWLDAEDFTAFSRYLRDYLCSEAVFGQLSARLLSVIGLRFGDEGARRQARREYVRLVLDDYVLNPGPTAEPWGPGKPNDERDYGLMEVFVHRWQSRLPEALASAAGEHVTIPSGNDELSRLLTAY